MNAYKTLKQKQYYDDVMRLHFELGYSEVRISKILPVCQTTIHRWIANFTAENKGELAMKQNKTSASGLSLDQDSIKYEDRFISPSHLIAISKNKRTLESSEIKRIQDPETRIELFVRKNKDDEGSKEFYYLGRLRCRKDSLVEMLNAQLQSIVEIGYQLETPVPAGLYEYLISNAV